MGQDDEIREVHVLQLCTRAAKISIHVYVCLLYVYSCSHTGCTLCYCTRGFLIIIWVDNKEFQKNKRHVSLNIRIPLLPIISYLKMNPNL